MASLIYAEYRELNRFERLIWNQREKFANATSDKKMLDRAIHKEDLYGFIIFYLNNYKQLVDVNKLIDSNYVPIHINESDQEYTIIIMVHTSVCSVDVNHALFRYLRKHIPSAITGCMQGLIEHDTFREYYNELIMFKQINHVKYDNGEIEYYSPLH
jgi:hypothetical protein